MHKSLFFAFVGWLIAGGLCAPGARGGISFEIYDGRIPVYGAASGRIDITLDKDTLLPRPLDCMSSTLKYEILAPNAEKYVAVACERISVLGVMPDTLHANTTYAVPVYLLRDLTGYLFSAKGEYSVRVHAELGGQSWNAEAKVEVVDEDLEGQSDYLAFLAGMGGSIIRAFGVMPRVDEWQATVRQIPDTSEYSKELKKFFAFQGGGGITRYHFSTPFSMLNRQEREREEFLRIAEYVALGLQASSDVQQNQMVWLLLAEKHDAWKSGKTEPIMAKDGRSWRLR